MNAKHLQKLLEMRHVVEVEYENGNWIRFVHYNKEKTKCPFVSNIQINYSAIEMETWYTNNYRIVTPETKLLEMGDKVEIVGEYGKDIDHVFGGKELHILSVDNQYLVANGEVAFYFPHWAVAPILEEETIDINGKTYNRQAVEERLAELEEVK